MSRNEIIQTFTSEIVAANDARLEGQLTRDQHAAIIARIDNSMQRNSITWDDINQTWNN